MEETYYAFNPWWKNKSFGCGIMRRDYLSQLKSLIDRKQINIIIGSRRVGKTTLIKQIIKQVLDKSFPPNQIFYLALDHPKLSKIPISEHLKSFRRIFMHPRNVKLWLFLDEVQESPDWEIELKSIYDLENIKIICTGSTSSLLKSQGGKLTGRQIVTQVYPLSFKEFLLFKKLNLDRDEDYKYEKFLEDYFQTGGYPENVLQPSEEYLYNLLDDIIARDIVRLYQIRKPSLLKDLLQFLAGSVGSRISFNKLANVLSISVDTVKEYIGCLESAFLVRQLEKWTTSHSEKIYAAKKIYFMDTGLKTLLTGKGDLGAKAENIVFLKFLREKRFCGYFAESEREVDFVMGSVGNPLPVEVKYDSKFDWKDKKFSGTKLFLRKYHKTKKVLIISKDINKELKENKITLQVIPLWKFLLDY